MLSLEMLLLFVPTITILIILPGPDFAIVSKISFMDGRRQGQAAALGVALGICLHTILAMAGISAILAQSALLFTLLKYMGSAYLFYIGVKEIWHGFKKDNPASIENNYNFDNAHARNGIRKAFYTGFLTNALNPKAILYFMVLYPQFINPDQQVYVQFMEMGLLTIIICIAWYMILVLLIGKIKNIFSSENFQRWLSRVTGGIFIIFGIKLAAQELE